MKLAKGIWFLIILSLLSILAGVTWLMTSSYDDIIHFALEQLQRPDLKELLEGQYFTLDKYNRLQRVGYAAIPVLLALIGFLIVKRKNVFSALVSIFSMAKRFVIHAVRSIKECDRTTKVLLFILVSFVLARSVYYALYCYPQYDECWNYNYFLSNNLFTTFFAYSNYPLHNLVTFITLKLVPDSTFVMRLPNIIIGLLNLLMVFDPIST